ncbi:MAG: DUF2860 domain-containing protein [Trichlorobacter sp.]|uniref:DUF2860 family protein n=1 Tax=Trichlorobacter sp. TaxID=2911007 RepID=UPI00256D98BF|nr:DUF2860 family protein [Trichlorobacter sp.]MDK9716857.1 DUF2860 domain-containing protein [Trichlorobacter sp.]
MHYTSSFLSLLLTIIMLLTAVLPSQADNFTADVGAGMLVISKSDNLWGRGKSSITSLGDSPQSQTVVMAIPALLLRYRQDSLKNTWFAGATEEDYGRVAIGVKHDLEKGAVEAALFYSFMGSEWEDPYTLNRNSTSVQNFGLRAGWEKITGSPFSVHYTVSAKLVNNDLSGERYSALKRDGTKHRLGITYTLKLTETLTLTPSLAFEREIAEGAANRYSSPIGAVSLVWRLQDLTWINRVSGAYAFHDSVNPVFGKTLKEPGYSATSLVLWKNPFDFKKYWLTAGTVYGQTIPNITFFEKRSNYFFLLGGYSF